MTYTPKELFERYVWAGMTRDVEAQTALFTPDGVFEAPLLPVDSPAPRRMRGHDELRAGLAVYHRIARAGRRPDPERSGYVLHTTADPDVFIAEIDTVMTGDGADLAMSLVQIFRVREGRIASLRDFFDPGLIAAERAETDATAAGA
ncbi:ketosteroid isomerase-like protein [Krasilnikovia cinnamomea]|uniref:Ketosteroid isomerase-like protein n=1 Tax=Krasilnikovia cinnamomea TaxID=349313 RepID=A0A4Q7ZNU1_9ACTN|nr:nuclear transport factor 2 family protein [Krasilnikovia cinnamomea]RZU52717.1 ketosteroid isomerase-like protein [Krasilnikovia cinnamomea]